MNLIKQISRNMVPSYPKFRATYKKWQEKKK